MQMWLMPMKEELALGIVGIVALVVVAHRRGTDVLGEVVHAGAVFGIAHRLAGLQVHRLEHVDGVVDLVGRDERAVRSVERVDDAVPVRMGQELAVLAVLVLLVRQHHHVDAGVIPLVVRGLLVAELGLTRIGVAAEDGHRPLVVAGTHGLVPRRRVAGAEVDQVGAGIVGVPAPSWCRRRSSRHRPPRWRCRGSSGRNGGS